MKSTTWTFLNAHSITCYLLVIFSWNTNSHRNWKLFIKIKIFKSTYSIPISESNFLVHSQFIRYPYQSIDFIKIKIVQTLRRCMPFLKSLIQMEVIFQSISKLVTRFARISSCWPLLFNYNFTSVRVHVDEEGTKQGEVKGCSCESFRQEP